MRPDVGAVLALAAAAAASTRKGINAGLVGLVLAAIGGRFALGLPPERVASHFPSGLFLMLLGVSLLFGLAKLNGTLDLLASFMLRRVRSRPVMLPAAFFVLALAVSATGAGNIAAVALLAPVALETGRRAGIGPIPLAFMLVAGANAGTFSPLAFTGVVAAALTAKAGLELAPWSGIFLPVLASQASVAALVYAVFGRGFGRPAEPAPEPKPAELDGRRAQTLAALAALAVASALFRADVGQTAMFLALALGLSGAGDLEAALRGAPWQAIVMVCGMATLVGMAGEAGGLSLLAGWLSRFGEPAAVTGALSFAAAFASIYSSSSGVVMPAFLPLVPELAQRSGASPGALVTAVNVSSHLVDVSPLSTLGALCVAAVPAAEKESVFRRLLYLGLAMSAAAALLGYLVLARLA